MVRNPGCRYCGGSLVSISFTVRGRERTMRSCSACDRREWLIDGHPAHIDEVVADLHHTSHRAR